MYDSGGRTARVHAPALATAPLEPPYYHRVRLVPSMGEASTAGGATTQRKNEGTSRSHGEEALKKKG